MIYDWTDPIFRWRIWHLCKWLFGIALAVAVVYFMIYGFPYEQQFKAYLTQHNIPT